LRCTASNALFIIPKRRTLRANAGVCCLVIDFVALATLAVVGCGVEVVVLWAFYALFSIKIGIILRAACALFQY